jgi:hypothetical protein
MVVEDLDEVTLDLDAEGEEVRRTIGRRTWQRGGWATIAIAYEQRMVVAGSEADDPAWTKKVALLRMHKVGGGWRKHAAITLAGDDALALAGELASWLGP